MHCSIHLQQCFTNHKVDIIEVLLVANDAVLYYGLCSCKWLVLECMHCSIHLKQGFTNHKVDITEVLFVANYSVFYYGYAAATDWFQNPKNKKKVNQKIYHYKQHLKKPIKFHTFSFLFSSANIKASVSACFFSAAWIASIKSSNILPSSGLLMSFGS